MMLTALERPDGGYLVVGDQDQIDGNYNIIMMGCDSLSGMSGTQS